MRLASNGRLGIGVTVPLSELHVAGSTGATLTLENANTALAGDDIIGSINFRSNDASEDGNETQAYVRAVATDATPDTALVFGTLRNNGGQDDTVQERMRITPDGALNIGSNVANLHTNNTDVTAMQWTGNFLGVSRATTTTEHALMYLNRQNSDGEALSVRRNGVKVGHIGVTANDNLVVACDTSGHSGLEFSSLGVLPQRNGVILAMM